jgi:hypothetical protein
MLKSHEWYCALCESRRTVQARASAAKDEEVKGIVTIKYLLLAHGGFTLRKLREVPQQNHCARYDPAWWYRRETKGMKERERERTRTVLVTCYEFVLSGWICPIANLLLCKQCNSAIVHKSHNPREKCAAATLRDLFVIKKRAPRESRWESQRDSWNKT